LGKALRSTGRKKEGVLLLLAGKDRRKDGGYQGKRRATNSCRKGKRERHLHV